MYYTTTGLYINNFFTRWGYSNSTILNISKSKKSQLPMLLFITGQWPSFTHNPPKWKLAVKNPKPLSINNTRIPYSSKKKKKHSHHSQI